MWLWICRIGISPPWLQTTYKSQRCEVHKHLVKWRFPCQISWFWAIQNFPHWWWQSCVNHCCWYPWVPRPWVSIYVIISFNCDHLKNSFYLPIKDWHLYFTKMWPILKGKWLKYIWYANNKDEMYWILTLNDLLILIHETIKTINKFATNMKK